MQRKVNLQINLQNVTVTEEGDTISVTIDGDPVGDVVVPTIEELGLIEVDGQSLAVAHTDGEVLSPVNTDTRLKMLQLASGGGPRTFYDSVWGIPNNENIALAPGQVTGITTLAENLTTNDGSIYGETVCTGAGLQMLDGITDQSVEYGFSVFGLSARSLDGIGPGSPNYQNMHIGDIEWRRHSTKPVKRLATFLIHDHAHIFAEFTTVQQRDRLLEYVNDRQAQVYALVKSRTEFPIITVQSGNATYSTKTNEQCRAVWHGTLDAVAQSDFLHLGCPMYFLATHDGTHLTAASESLLGEYLAKVLKYVMAGTWKHTGFDHSRSHDLNGTTLFVPCQSYSGSLKVNTDPVVERPNYGFNFEDGGGGGVTLSGNPTIDNAAGGLVFELSGTPSGGTLYSGSSATTPTQIGQDPTNAASAGVNISDTDSTIGARSGTALPNWFVADRWENI